MPIAPPTNPLLDLMYQQGSEVAGDTITREEMFEIQREQEGRLLGTFFVQAIFLSMAILLYSSWDWSQFGEPYEAALFYGLMGFSLQAALYFSFRTLFEDSSNHRKELKRMKNRQKRSMATMSFQMRKMQTENLLHQQMGQYQAQMKMAQSDGVIDNREKSILQQTLNQIQNTAEVSGLGNLNNAQDLESLARQLGIDRFRVGPIPLGPKLVLNQAPMSNLNIPTTNKLDLTPTPITNMDPQSPENLA